MARPFFRKQRGQGAYYGRGGRKYTRGKSQSSLTPRSIRASASTVPCSRQTSLSLPPANINTGRLASEAVASTNGVLPQELDDEDLCQVIMAIDIKDRGTVGCSYYNAQEEKLYILEDIARGGKDIVDKCKHTYLPISLKS